jgi:hypothetical protein
VSSARAGDKSLGLVRPVQLGMPAISVLQGLRVPVTHRHYERSLSGEPSFADTPALTPCLSTAARSRSRYISCLPKALITSAPASCVSLAPLVTHLLAKCRVNCTPQCRVEALDFSGCLAIVCRNETQRSVSGSAPLTMYTPRGMRHSPRYGYVYTTRPHVPTSASASLREHIQSGTYVRNWFQT